MFRVFTYLSVVQANGVSCNLGSLHSLFADMFTSGFFFYTREVRLIYENGAVWRGFSCEVENIQGQPVMVVRSTFHFTVDID